MTTPGRPEPEGGVHRVPGRRQARLYGYIHSLIPDINDADDLYQQTALVLWNKFGEFDRARDFFAWACGVARGEAANFARRRARQRLYLSADVNLLLVEAHAEFTDAEAGRPAGRSDAVRREAPAGRPRTADRVLPRAGRGPRGGRPPEPVPAQRLQLAPTDPQGPLRLCQPGSGPPAGPGGM